MAKRPLNALGEKEQEAIEELVACFELRFTGTFVVEFSEGRPVLRKRTDTKRFGERAIDCTERRAVG